MSFLSLVTTVVDAANQRIDQPQDDGTYAPVVLRIGDNLAASADPLGGQTAIQIDAITAAPSGDTPLAVAAAADPGTSTTVSKSDHVHDLSWGAVAAAAGLATSPLSIQTPWGVVADHVELGASPAGSGQVRATDGALVAWNDSGTDRDALSTSGADLTVGPSAGAVAIGVGPAASFSVTDGGTPRILATHLATSIEKKLSLYSGTATAATAAGDIGLDSTGRLTVFADGAEKTVLVTGDASGGGATLYPTLGVTDLGFWGFSESSGNFANSGTSGALDLVPSGTAPVYQQAQPLGAGVYSSIATRIESAVTTAIQPTSAATILLLIKPQYLSDPTSYTGVFGLADPSASILPFALFLATNTAPAAGYRPQGVWYAAITTSAGTSVLTMADGVGNPDYTGYEHNQWNLLAMTYDGTTLSAYVNGGIVNTMAVAGGAIDYSSAPNLRVIAGGSASAGSWRTIGRLGFLRIQNSALSASDIRLAYRSAMAWA